MPYNAATRLIRTRAAHVANRQLKEAHRIEWETYFAAALEEEQRTAAEDLARSKVEHPDAGPPVKPPGSPGGRFKAQPPVPPRRIPGPPPRSMVQGTAAAPTPESPEARRERIRRLREDVARCPYCIAAHARGHRCSQCGTRPHGVAAPLSAVRLVELEPSRESA